MTAYPDDPRNHSGFRCKYPVNAWPCIDGRGRACSRMVSSYGNRSGPLASCFRLSDRRKGGVEQRTTARQWQGRNRVGTSEKLGSETGFQVSTSAEHRIVGLWLRKFTTRPIGQILGNQTGTSCLADRHHQTYEDHQHQPARQANCHVAVMQG